MAASIHSVRSQRGGSVFRHVMKRRVSFAEIHLDPTPSDRRPNPRCWLTSETVSGCVIYGVDDDTHLTHSKIVLRGTVHVTTKGKSCTQMQPTCRDEDLVVLLASSEVEVKPEHEAQHGQAVIPFSFNLRDLEIDNSRLSHLPPSLCSKKDGWRSNDSQYNITYSISASAFSGEHIEVKATTTISILPVWDNDPNSSSIPGECFAAKEIPARFKRRLKRTPDSCIYIAAEEPKCLHLSPFSPSTYGITGIPIVLKIPKSLSNLSEYGSLPSRCKVEAHLVQKDTFTADGITKLSLGINCTRADEAPFTQSCNRREQQSTFELIWQQYKSCPNESFSLASFTFPFKIEDDETLVPSFFTPLLARKYSINLVLSFPDTLLQSWKLSLPLEIKYVLDSSKV